MAELIERASSTLNPKIHSDSGYGSNKSNSQSQRSSGSSKSQQSSLSSGSGKGYPPHKNAPVSNADCCQLHGIGSPGTGSANSTSKRQGKKSYKLGRKHSSGEKNEARTCHDGSGKDVKSNGLSQPMELGVSSMPSTPQPQSQMSPGSKGSSTHTHDSKALQVAALTHALSCMKKFQEPISESETNEETNDSTRSNKIHWQDYFSENFKDASNEDAFASVVSLDDGVVVYVTPTISQILGFPKDMLCGRSFIDFVHPKDRMAFASHITCGINFPIGEHSPVLQTVSGPTVKSEPFYCRLRQYRGLKTVGFGVVDKTILYHPFKLTMALKNVETAMHAGTAGRKANRVSLDLSKNELGCLKDESGPSNDGFTEPAFTSPSGVHNTMYLVIVATRIKSAYQYPNEIPKSPGKFVTRHSASCHFGHMDSEAISYLGHLPQDLIGNSVLDYYHPEDMPLLKDIYEAVMQEQGKPFRSKPYRFRVFNGSFALLETDWSCFINPWSWKLEFVIGQHRVLQGPMNPNVFMQPPKDEDELLKLSGGIISDGHEMQDEIRKMLTETVTRRLSDPMRQQSSRRRKDLAALMETLLEQMAKTENSDKSGSQCSDFSVMERDSVMLGEISPHHDDYSCSNQSSSTPPSYNQLNYRENIERFFQSQPKTVRSDESADSGKMDVQNRSSDSDSKCSPQIDYSSSSNIRNSSGTSNESGGERMNNSVQYGSNGSLTQELLTRHNEDMEKCMIQRHKDSRGTHGSHKESRLRHPEHIPFATYPVSRSMNDSSDFYKYSRTEKTKKNIHKVCSASYFCQNHTKTGYTADDNLYDFKCDAAHGLKRTGNFSWDGDSHNAKQPHLDDTSVSNSIEASNSNTEGHFPQTNSINLWPPFSINMTPGITTPSFSSAGQNGQFSNSVGGVGIPGYHYVDHTGGQQSYISTDVPTGRQTFGTTSVLDPINTNPGAPLIFVPGQQQFVSQQVQLVPAGFVYQTISPQIFGQHPQILMQLGTMIHSGPGPSVMLSTPTSISQLTGQSQPSTGINPPTSLTVCATPLLSNTDRRSSRSNSISSGGGRGLSSTAGIPTVTNSNSTSVQITPSITKTSTSTVGRSLETPILHTEVSNPSGFSYLTTSAKKQVSTLRKNAGLISDAYMTSSCGDSDGSGSEQSMNTSNMSLNTKDSKDYLHEYQCCSEQEMKWQSSEANLKQCHKSLKNVRNNEPPWLEKVEMTEELTFRYRLEEKDLTHILEKDLKTLKIIGQQSSLVNDQLSMLYDDLMLDRFSKNDMNLEETRSNISDDELLGTSRESKTGLNPSQYDKIVMIYEENAPFPPETLPIKKEKGFKPFIPISAASSSTTTIHSL